MLTRTQKKELVDDLSDKIKRQKSLILTDVTGVSVGDIQGLRKELRFGKIEYQVAKKTLIDLAMKKEKKDFDVSGFTGSLAVAFSYDDPIAPIKILSKFAKTHEKFRILGGIMENKVLTIEEIKELAAIPSKQELLARLVNSIKSPLSGLVNVLEGNFRNLVGLLSAIKK